MYRRLSARSNTGQPKAERLVVFVCWSAPSPAKPMSGQLALTQSVAIRACAGRKADLMNRATRALLDELIGGVSSEKTNLSGTNAPVSYISRSLEFPMIRAFRPEPFNAGQRSFTQNMRASLRRGGLSFGKRNMRSAAAFRDQAKEVLRREQEIWSREKTAARSSHQCRQNRIHGDYVCGSIAFTGKDIVILDFEGEPASEPLERSKTETLPHSVTRWHDAIVPIRCL